MGAHLSKLAAQGGAEVTITTRQSKDSGPRIEYLRGDAHDNGFLGRVLGKEWDCIVDFMVYSTEAFRERMPLLLGGTGHYLFLSSCRVFGNSDGPITECSPRLLEVCRDAEYLQTDEYALAKARQENLLIESGQANWTIVRPYITYAEQRLQLGVLEKEGWLYRFLNGRTVVFDREMYKKRTTMTYGPDVARALWRLVGNNAAFGECFNLTCGEARSWDDIWAIYREALLNEAGIDGRIQFVDRQVFEHIHGSRYQIVYDRLLDRVFDSRKIDTIVGESSYTRLEEGLRECIRDFLAKRNFGAIDPRAEALKDRATGEFAKPGEFSTYRSKLKYLAYRFGIKK